MTSEAAVVAAVVPAAAASVVDTAMTSQPSWRTELIHTYTLTHCNSTRVAVLYLTHLTPVAAQRIQRLFAQQQTQSIHNPATATFAPINSQFLASLFVLQCTLQRTIHDCVMQRDVRRARNVYGELLFNLAPSNHIQSSIEKMQCNAKCQSTVIVMLNSSLEQITQFLNETVQCDSGAILSSVDRIAHECDPALIRRTYKINDDELKSSVTQLLKSSSAAAAASASQQQQDVMTPLAAQHEALSLAVLGRLMTK